MNRRVNGDIFTTIIGMAVAGVVGFYFGKKYVKSKVEDEIKRRVAIEVSDWLQKQAEDICKAQEDTKKPADEPEKPADNGTVMTGDISIQDGDWNIEKYRNYVECYDPDIAEATAHPTEDEDYINDVEGEILTEEYNNSSGPRVMEWEEIGQPGLGDELVLLWHIDEHWMETEDGEMIDDPYQLVGDTLETSGFSRNRNQKTIHIINPQRGEVYEILKVVGRSID